MSNTSHAYWALNAGCPVHVLTRFQKADAEFDQLRARVAELEQDKAQLFDSLHAILARAVRSDSQACNTIERHARAAIDAAIDAAKGTT